MIDFFTTLKAQQDAWQLAVQAAPMMWSALFFILYLLSFALALPIGIVMMLTAGAVFGFTWGLLLVTLGSSVGCLCAFWLARWVLPACGLQGWVDQRFGQRLAAIQDGIAHNGTHLLLSLRLLPLFPPVLINIGFGLSYMTSLRFYFCSLFGMLPISMLYVNAGTQLSSIISASDVLSGPVLLSLALLATLPWLLRLVMRHVR